ncbi:MAG: hypothetical protein DSM107014_05815 [Gomphosphaeria aponina SAG 52.96 = DSM 107014]|uniref:Uncharacterized protein n=1 Tax=Gomphosphaeria aponina SAG 52.96 = DSM 107014 TaxID=1521640 RepID=A0A941JSU7_9CHRO|nr:hypothetical protein [Gomphosphaeria aponina SAG 52.96 = DSM 107014]
MKSISLFLPLISLLLIFGYQSNSTANSSGESFNEEMYLFANPDVAELIKQGKYESGLDHYIQVGQTATKPDGEHYASFFTGTDGNDMVRVVGTGQHNHVMGVGLEIVSTQEDDDFPVGFKSLGEGEIDVLIGTIGGVNEFVLGSFITSVNPTPQPFYVGQGDQDYAKIQNFTKGKDMIVLAGNPDQYQWESIDGNVRISTSSGDLVAIVEAMDNLEIEEVYEDVGIFILK